MNQEDYIANHTKQLSVLFKKGYIQQLVLSQQYNKFYFPSLLEAKLYQDVINKLENKNNLKGTQLCWLIIAQEAVGQNYLKGKADLREKFGDKYAQIVEKWLDTHQNVYRPITNTKSQIRDAFQKLNQKAMKQGFYSLKQVPVFLVSTQWLQKFYSDQDCQMPAIDNRHLLEPIQFIDTDPEYFHLNYAVSTNAKQNQHFKIVSYEAWKLIYNTFNGIQVKRFTTNQKKPIVQIWYKKILISILEQRCFHCINFQFLVPKFYSFKKIVQRVKRLLIAYKCVPFESISKTIDIIKVKDMTLQEMLEEIQQDDINETQNQNFQVIDLELDVEQAKIYSQKQMIIFNLHQKNTPSFFRKTKRIKSIITRQKCLNCGKQDDIFQCICKSVHFCSQKCQNNHKAHSKQCIKIRKQQNQIAKLIRDYEITQKQINFSLEEISNSGKVGFENLGNTCYYNAALQCVLRVSDLSQYFLRNDHLKDINVGNVLGSQGHLACAFGELVKQYYTTKKRRLQPIDVLRIIAKNPQFRGHNHQDSQQFLNYFLDKLHQDLNTIKNKPYLSDVQSNGRPDQIVSKQSWENYLKRNKSYVSSLFTGQYRSEIRCPDCGKISITFDPFMSVTLPFPRQETTEELKGYVLSKQGEYQKIQLDFPVSMRTDQFYQKIFKTPVSGVYILDKIIRYQWDQSKKVTSNIQSKGILLFYPKPLQYVHQLNLKILEENGQMDAFQRRIYSTTKINSVQELHLILFKSIRKPISKALKFQTFQTQEEYVQFCQQKNLIILETPDLQFPLKDKTYSIKFKLNPQFVFNTKIKYNFSSGEYEKKSQLSFRKANDEVTINSMLESFKMPQQLTEDNMWYCNVCKDHKQADKIMAIYKLPKYLIMHVKRFNHRGAKYRNRNLIIGQKISTPLQLQEFQIINGKKYEMIGVVNHFGSLASGHYTAYVKKEDWYYYDDESVRKSSVNGNNAYLIFYQMVEQKKTKLKQEK